MNHANLVSIGDIAANFGPTDWVVADSNVWRLYSDRFGNVNPLLVPAGEQSKSIEQYSILCRELALRGARRDHTLIALGGGVVGDLAGFVAATFMRGIKLIQVPTTLLAMVDSSIGGKVGIDLPEGKNLLGSFHQPERTDVALEFLRTLDDRQLRNGMAEVAKYGFIAEPGILRLVPGDWETIVPRCIDLKARIVEEDPHERKGLRAILNFGHTVGHAIEQVLNYDVLLHGEAISVGMRVEAELSELLGVAPAGTASQVSNHLEKLGLPVVHEAANRAEDLIDAMRRDKKAKGTGLAFSLLTGIGGCTLVTGVDEDVVRSVLTG